MPHLRISAEVQDALAHGHAVVGLESTIYSHLGLPSPANLEALERSTSAIRAQGAVPAITAILDGMPCVGLEPHEHERILGPAQKTAERDISIAVVQGWPVGATTVSASLALCAAAGISVFATGGIGGVHLGSAETADVSGDLGAIAVHPLVTVCAGAKAFLDIPKTVEFLETEAVPVLGYQTDEFPMFYAQTSGVKAPVRVESPAEVAAILVQRMAWDQGGVLLGVPIPAADAIPAEEIRGAIDAALARTADVRGGAVTPLVLEQISEITAGRSIPANLALAENNAKVAAQVAVALSQLLA
ncbi:MAG: pseudouridine-5'-phosphate glycosidase [Acidimicrobiia bacterium]|nr:pseudouridine-5'-phosphate glycosidase [Acidimicrobiia bacterium]